MWNLKTAKDVLLGTQSLYGMIGMRGNSLTLWLVQEYTDAAIWLVQEYTDAAIWLVHEYTSAAIWFMQETYSNKHLIRTSNISLCGGKTSKKEEAGKKSLYPVDYTNATQIN